MASVIQLFTRRADGITRRPRGSVQIDGGTYGTVHASASVAGATSRLDYSGGVAQFSSDNRVPNSSLDNTTLSGNLGIRVSPTATLRVISRAELENVGTPGPTAFGRPDLDAFFDRDDVALSVSFDQSPNGSFTQRGVLLDGQFGTDVDQPRSRSAVHGNFRGAHGHAPVERLSWRHARRSAPPSRELPGRPPSGGLGVLRRSSADAHGRLGRRTGDPGGPAGANDNRQFQGQLRGCGAAADALAEGLCDRRRSNRAQRKLRDRPGAAGDACLRRADRRRERSARPVSRRAPGRGSRNRR